MKVSGGIMNNARVKVDGVTYEGVTFNNCTMLYDGTGGAMGFIKCAFNNCVWEFVGPAGNTIGFINDLLRQQGPRKREFIEKMFGKIND